MRRRRSLRRTAEAWAGTAANTRAGAAAKAWNSATANARAGAAGPEQRRCQCQAMDIGIHIQKQAKAHKNAPQTYKDQHNTCDNVLSHCKLYTAVYAGGLLLVHSPKDMKLKCSQRAESFDFSLVLFTIPIYHFIMKVLLLRKRRQTVNIDQLLYQYIIDNIADITEKWFSLRCQLKGELYSASHLSEETKTLLTEQHTFTNITIASAFLEDQTDFQENMTKWAQNVAKNRVEQDVQVHEVVEAISNSRISFWDAVVTFIKENQEIVTNEDADRWNRIVNQSFDKLIIEFSEQYQKFMLMRLTSQQELISELGCPVISIADGIGILPLIGSIDTKRAHVILETVPVRCVERKITSLVVDLSGVPIVDTMVAQQLYNLSKTLFLLGVKAVFSGIRPDVAQTSIQLGLDFSEYETYGTLKQALENMGVRCIVEELEENK